jgi:hypothetical protein
MKIKSHEIDLGAMEGNSRSGIGEILGCCHDLKALAWHKNFL